MYFICNSVTAANVFIIMFFLLVVFLLYTQFVPCNILHSFNESVGKTVLFHALGSTYNIDVSKGRSRTRLHGEGWEEFVTKNNLNAGDLLIFTMSRPNPKISVAVMHYSINEQESENVCDTSDASD